MTSQKIQKQPWTMMLSIRSRLATTTTTRTACTRFAKRTLATNDESIPTALHDWHVQKGGRMVPFAGYALPVQYANMGVLKEHMHCRQACSLFDVSHMGQIRWHGPDRVKFLEKMVVSDIAGLQPGSACLSLITNEQGNILDDTVLTQYHDYTYMVVNGATKHADMAHFAKYMDKYDVEMEYLEDGMQLLALQGPQAMEVLAPLVSLDLEKMPFMSGTEATIAGIDDCRVTRCGYTGEDGFELAVPFERTVELADCLMDNDAVQPAGLGARDSLRLEAGLCLYGNDLDDTINPVQAALSWTMGGPKSRRRLEGGGFLGCEHVLTPEGKLKKQTTKRIGISGMKAPARQGTPIFVGDVQVGHVTSGTFAPSLKKPIAMGYVQTEFAKVDTPLELEIRGKRQAAVVTKMPFVEANYFKL